MADEDELIEIEVHEELLPDGSESDEEAPGVAAESEAQEKCLETSQTELLAPESPLALQDDKDDAVRRRCERFGVPFTERKAGYNQDKVESRKRRRKRMPDLRVQVNECGDDASKEERELVSFQFRISTGKKRRRRLQLVDGPEALENPKHRELAKSNPHLIQGFATGRFEEGTRKFEAVDRELRFAGEDNPSPITPSEYRHGEVASVVSWSQRGELLVEIEFLTEFGKPGCTVLVTEATNVGFLAELFPDLHLLSVKDEGRTLQQHEEDFEGLSNVSLLESLSHDSVKPLCEKDVLFISVCSRPLTDQSTSLEDGWLAQMKMQDELALIMKPRISLMRFRLPEGEGLLSYVDGRLRLPLWHDFDCKDAWLLVRDANEEARTYDQAWFEDALYHHNTVVRTSYFDHSAPRGEIGLDHCYDCAAEIWILKEYLRAVRSIQSDSDWYAAQLSVYISRSIGSGRRML